jgi:hypothetical protein
VVEGYRLTIQPPPDNLKKKSEEAETAKKEKKIVLEDPLTHWTYNLPDMPEPRAGAGTFVIGKTIAFYVHVVRLCHCRS